MLRKERGSRLGSRDRDPQLVRSQKRGRLKDRILTLLRTVESITLADLRSTIGDAAVTAALSLVDDGKLTRTADTLRLTR